MPDPLVAQIDHIAQRADRLRFIARGVWPDPEPATKPAHPQPKPRGWMNTPSAAEYLGVTEGYLRNQRSAGTGPAYGKTTGGNGAVRYRQTDLDAWLERGGG